MEQSDQIKRIEHFATQTTTKVEKGGGALDKAREIKIKVLKASYFIHKHNILISTTTPFAEKDLALVMDNRYFIDYNLVIGHILARKSNTILSE